MRTELRVFECNPAIGWLCGIYIKRIGYRATLFLQVVGYVVLVELLSFRIW